MPDQHYFQSVLQETSAAILESASEHGYTAVLFVDASGNNTDGLTWTNAYTSIPTALAACGANDFTLINIGAGVYDINITGNPTYTVNVHIKGLGREITQVKNTHGSATAVLKFTVFCMITDLTIDCGTGEDGIILDGTNAHGSILDNLTFDCAALAGAADGIQLTGGIKFLKIHNIHIHGETTNTTGIRTSDSLDNEFNNIHIHDSLVGIHLDNTADHSNHFTNLHIMGCAKGLLIDTGADNNMFTSIEFHNNTVNSDDTGAGTFYKDVKLDTEIIKVTPVTASVGTLLTSKNVINTYADSDIAVISNITTPFKIIGAFLGNPTDATATYLAKIIAGSVTFIEGLLFFEGKFGGNGFTHFKTNWFAKNTAITANVKTENAAADAVELWLLYVAM